MTSHSTPHRDPHRGDQTSAEKATIILFAACPIILAAIFAGRWLINL